MIMNNEGEVSGGTAGSLGWALVFVVAAIQTLSAIMLLLVSGPATFEDDTGIAWSELTDVYPTVATQFSTAQQASLIGTLAIGLFSLAITYFALRDGQRWAWWTMWILPASILPSILSLAQMGEQAWVAVFGGVFVLLAVIGLLISYRVGFPKKSEAFS
jgi:cbb3-type cytochrome oxidase subunit 3